MVKFEHQSVMPGAVLDLLVTDQTGVYVDATLGAGGHAALMLKTYPKIQVIGIDQDSQALDYAQSQLGSYKTRCRVAKGNFRYLGALLRSMGVTGVQGVLFDLGVSSPQLDQRDRGFSYQNQDAPLDMRMDADNPITAFRLVNQKPERDLAEAIRTFGEERWAARIAEFIVKARQQEPIRTSGQLVQIIRAAIPQAARRGGGHPARRTFQALRIWVNDELGALSDGLNEGWQMLTPNGRMAVLSFHSLEDRIVKKRFREWSDTDQAQLLTKHPRIADPDEVTANPRARSAKLRVAEKIGH